MAKNLVAQVAKAGGEFELVEREIVAPGPGEVRIKVAACGICFSDHLVKDGAWPGMEYPRVPGHEVVGVIDEVGAGVTEWKKGERVGVGWHGGHCFVCTSCRRGDFMTCEREQITGVTRDGGFQQYMIARHEAVALLPEGISWAEGGRCCVRGSLHLMRCGIAERAREIWWRCRESAGWGIWGFSMRRSLGIAWWALDAGRKMRSWRKSWARLRTLTARRRRRLRSCRNWAGRK